MPMQYVTIVKIQLYNSDFYQMPIHLCYSWSLNDCHQERWTDPPIDEWTQDKSALEICVS